MTDDLVERLRTWATFGSSWDDVKADVRPDLHEAADAILKLQGEVAERSEWAKTWHDIIETLATIHGLGILDADEVIPAFGRYVDSLKAEKADLRTRLEAAEAEVARMREIIEHIAQECLSEDDGPVEQLEHILGIVSALQGERT